MLATGEANIKIDIPWFGARRVARDLAIQVEQLRTERDRIFHLGRQLIVEVKQARHERDWALYRLDELNALPAFQREMKKLELEADAIQQISWFNKQIEQAGQQLLEVKSQIDKAHRDLVVTDELILLQEAGIYHYRHPLTDVVAYENALKRIEDQIKQMAKTDGGAILSANTWAVNGSASQGRKMLRDMSKLMLRAFNAEADELVRTLKPYKLSNALDRLQKVAQTIEKLGKVMSIQIAPTHYQLRVKELELTADYLAKEEKEKEEERRERERLREARKVQLEIERERERLEKERQHYMNALEALQAKGDEAGAARMTEQLMEVEKAVEDIDYREANERAGYVYVISNIGSFGERMVKVGMTRRLEPMDRIKELSDASVPFNFDIHALFFSKDAVGIEAEIHDRLSDFRVNTVNLKREFFRASPVEIKGMLLELAGELLQFHEIPEALEYRQCLQAVTRRP